jgi:hypothetical protein
MTATPAQRSMAGQIAAYSRWAKTTDRAAALKPANDARLAKFMDQVDPDGVLPPEKRLELALLARKAHMRRLALASSKKRAARKAA